MSYQNVKGIGTRKYRKPCLTCNGQSIFFNFFRIFLTGTENLKFTGQQGNLSLNSINVYNNLNPNKKF